MVTVDDFNFNEKKVLVRVDFNVPLDENFNVKDDSRIVAAIPTINKILSDGGAVIIMSHLGRPKSGQEDKFSLRHIIPALTDHLQREVKFAEDCAGPSSKKLAKDLNPGEVLLIENVRFRAEETKGDAAFAEELSTLGDFYVNDAFGSAHRNHSSTAEIANFFGDKKCLG
jgi:phosphoglycerate kinase